ncbi:hypothetical protein D4764_10G0005190 [Takifugu flavidus]|uniref:Uncharacterized protein n=1 Tax=Takifugu flavidus TaxID=433684 RepID=A0A5C6PKQ6_9TELE|nr:hypothetical protein D4764_10G0005190 [Takifugu flavidus]
MGDPAVRNLTPLTQTLSPPLSLPRMAILQPSSHRRCLVNLRETAEGENETVQINGLKEIYLKLSESVGANSRAIPHDLLPDPLFSGVTCRLPLAIEEPHGVAGFIWMSGNSVAGRKIRKGEFENSLG